MPAIHRHDDARACGATTVVSGNTTVYANSKLIYYLHSKLQFY